MKIIKTAGITLGATIAGYAAIKLLRAVAVDFDRTPL